MLLPVGFWWWNLGIWLEVRYIGLVEDCIGLDRAKLVGLVLQYTSLAGGTPLTGWIGTTVVQLLQVEVALGTIYS